MREEQARPLVSVIVPIYNTERYLERCLESIGTQTYSQLEVLLVDDGSTDGSSEIARRYAELDPRFRYFRQENRGVSSARNLGLDLAVGQHVSIVDSDDWLEPDLYDCAVSAMVDHHTDAVFYEYFVDFPQFAQPHFEPDPSTYGILDRAKAVSVTIISQNSFAWSRLFTAEVIGSTRFRTDLHWGEETVFVLEVLHKASSVCYLGRALYHYVQSETSATRSGFTEKRLSGILTADTLIEFTEAHYPTLVERAYSFKAGILTELIIDSIEADGPRVATVREFKSQLNQILRIMVFSAHVRAKEKLRWLLALMLPGVLLRLRTRRLHKNVSRRRVGGG